MPPRRQKMPKINVEVNKNHVAADADSLPSDPEKAGALFLNVEVIPESGSSASSAVDPNVVLLIDSSGSMSGEKIEKAREAAKMFIQTVDSVENVSVISFSGKSKIVSRGSGRQNSGVSKGLWDSITGKDVSAYSKQEMMGHVGNISARGSTALYQALEDAKKEISATNLPKNNRADKIILLSDGEPTKGPSSVSEFEQFAKQFANDDISLICAGIGADYNDDLLMALAKNSRGGDWGHLKQPDDIKDLFEQEATKIKNTTMVKPDLKIDPVKGAELGQLYKWQPNVMKIDDFDFVDGKYVIPIGDLVMGEKQSYVTQVFYPSRPEGDCRIAQVSISDKEEEDVWITYTHDHSEYEGEDNATPRNKFLLCKAKLKGTEIVNMDDKDTVIKEEDNLQTIIKDVDDTAKDPTVIKEKEKLETEILNRGTELIDASGEEGTVIKDNLTKTQIKDEKED